MHTIDQAAEAQGRSPGEEGKDGGSDPIVNGFVISLMFRMNMDSGGAVPGLLETWRRTTASSRLLSGATQREGATLGNRSGVLAHYECRSW